MPIYEYYCSDCQATFDTLRPMAEADTPIACPTCEGESTQRVLSLFAAISRGSDGTRALAGGGGCSACETHACHCCHSAN